MDIQSNINIIYDNAKLLMTALFHKYMSSILHRLYQIASLCNKI